jgi:hypothetical protein
MEDMTTEHDKNIKTLNDKRAKFDAEDKEDEVEKIDKKIEKAKEKFAEDEKKLDKEIDKLRKGNVK